MAAEEEHPDRLVIRRVIPASREEVFAAWIDPESIRHWMCPGDIVLAEAQGRPAGGGRVPNRDEEPDARIRSHGRVPGR